jgi:hypothetical protein
MTRSQANEIRPQTERDTRQQDFQQMSWDHQPEASFKSVNSKPHRESSPQWLQKRRPDGYPLANLLFQALFWVLSPKLMIQPNHKPYQPVMNRLP